MLKECSYSLKIKLISNQLKKLWKKKQCQGKQKEDISYMKAEYNELKSWRINIYYIQELILFEKKI